MYSCVSSLWHVQLLHSAVLCAKVFVDLDREASLADTGKGSTVGYQRSFSSLRRLDATKSSWLTLCAVASHRRKLWAFGNATAPMRGTSKTCRHDDSIAPACNSSRAAPLLAFAEQSWSITVQFAARQQSERSAWSVHWWTCSVQKVLGFVLFVCMWLMPCEDFEHSVQLSCDDSQLPSQGAFCCACSLHCKM